MSTSKELSISSVLPLNNSKFTIPQLGFGVYQSDQEHCINSCLSALKAGYRHIDTAQYYDNEALVGRAIKESKIPRSEIYVTTKILSAAGDLDGTVKAVIESVEKIDGGKSGYVDLFLIHSPHSGQTGRRLLWEALEKVKGMGKINDIGVSNFGIHHIEELKEFAKSWPPTVNQIELHPWCQQREVVSYCQKNNIVVEAYCPLVRNQKAEDPTLLSIARKHDKSTGQILLRYCLQKGWAPLPKSDNPQRIAANADLYGFHLDDKDMDALDGLDQGSKGAIVEAVKNE